MRWRRPLAVTWRIISTPFTSAAVRYVAGVVVLLGLGAYGEFYGHTHYEDGSTAKSVILGLSEAFLISGILTLLVDPFLKRRIQDEAAWSGIFGFLNEKAPRGLRKALRELAVCKVYFTKTTWNLCFEWDNVLPDVLSVTIDVRSTGENISREKHKLDAHLWVLASTTGRESEYLRYGVSCPGEFDAIDALHPKLAQYITTQNDGSLVLDEAGVTDGAFIPPQKKFELTKTARMYRNKNGYVPLHHGKFGENLLITLDGAALDDIDVRISHPAQEGRKKPYERKHKASRNNKPQTYHFRQITPGQVTIVSWKPREGERQSEIL